MVMVGTSMEAALLGGVGTSPVTHLPAQRASGGMRIAQRKNKRKEVPKDDSPTLPNEQLEHIAKITIQDDIGLVPAQVRQFTRAQKQKLENQQPKLDKACAGNNRPNVKRTGPIQQPRQGF